MAEPAARLDSVCVFCGSSEAADPDFLAAAKALGQALAKAQLKLVYGGGGVGLMGACARAAHEAGGRVLGIIPDFLVGRERALETVEHVIVSNMHQRKMMMFEAADAFVILPGGIGTLEEVVELLSWRRLELHAKPVVFYNPRDFWRPLFELFQMTVD
ncbi:MAG TPA: TIGR00730 family Rossman fold protein, partial [Phenylobacterium sp.]|nr:TIGR00730 family Rossman fold protein [Phenylobacterium sp.]